MSGTPGDGQLEQRAARARALAGRARRARANGSKSARNALVLVAARGRSRMTAASQSARSGSTQFVLRFASRSAFSQVGLEPLAARSARRRRGSGRSSSSSRRRARRRRCAAASVSSSQRRTCSRPLVGHRAERADPRADVGRCAWCRGSGWPAGSAGTARARSSVRGVEVLDREPNRPGRRRPRSARAAGR